MSRRIAFKAGNHKDLAFTIGVRVGAIALLLSLGLLWIPAQVEAGSLTALATLERTDVLTNKSTVEPSVKSVDYRVSLVEAKAVAEPKKNPRDILQAARQRRSAIKGVYPTALKTLHSTVLIRTTQVRQQIEQMITEKLNKPLNEKLNPSDRLQQTYQASIAHFKRFVATVVEGIAVQAHQTAENLR